MRILQFYVSGKRPITVIFNYTRGRVSTSVQSNIFRPKHVYKGEQLLRVNVVSNFTLHFHKHKYKKHRLSFEINMSAVFVSKISVTWRQTAVSPLLTYCRYGSHALSHRFLFQIMGSWIDVTVLIIILVINHTCESFVVSQYTTVQLSLPVSTLEALAAIRQCST